MSIWPKSLLAVAGLSTFGYLYNQFFQTHDIPNLDRAEGHPESGRASTAREGPALRAVWEAYFTAANASHVEFLERCALWR